jgi:hypothetical protein
MRSWPQLIKVIQLALSPELLSKSWKTKPGIHFTAGHCYCATEALYHLIGGKNSGFCPKVLSHLSWPDGLDIDETHWFLKHISGIVLDPTKEQFDCPIPYELGRGSGFLTKTPSRRAKIIMERVTRIE